QTPFDQRTSAAPMPAAATQIDQTLAGGVAGLTAYAWGKNSIYGEFGLYRSAPQGVGGSAGAGPLDSQSGGVISGYAPYWRLAYEKQWDQNSLMVGTYGLDVQLHPASDPTVRINVPLAGPTDHYRDIAFDAQYQFIGDEHLFSVQTTYIRENMWLDQSFALGFSSNPTDDLRTFRLGGTYYYQRKYGASLGYFSTTGSADAVRYGSGTAIFGSASGSPNSNGWIVELDYVPWQNVKFALQYTAYNKFNGASSNYDGLGRNASDNNTLYLLAWIAF